jgi:hypothetical protein
MTLFFFINIKLSRTKLIQKIFIIKKTMCGCKKNTNLSQSPINQGQSKPVQEAIKKTIQKYYTKKA